MNKLQLINDAAELRKKSQMKSAEAAALVQRSSDHSDQGEDIKAQKEAADAARITLEAQDLVHKAEEYEKNADKLEVEAQGYESELHDHEARVATLKQKIVETRGKQ